MAKDFFFMSQLSSHEALLLTSHFVSTAERMRVADAHSQVRAALCETASRIAFLRAHLIAKDEEIRPVFGGTSWRAAFAVA